MPAFQPQRFGSYVLTAHLGRGGMADVFRAQRTGAAGFERTAVVKRILGPYNDDPNFVSMFINEAKIAASLTHPNIAHVYELGEVDGEYFMAMELVKGKDLLHVLRYLARTRPQERHLPPDVAAFIARETSRGLAHAHDHTDEQGRPQPIVHRDVSPQNIMIGYDGQVKLVDFGIAKAMFVVREETRSGTLKGKIAYMSPEQVTGAPPQPESDVFSLGVVLYEMLIGRRLFKGENDYDTLQRVKSMVVPEPSRVASWVPPQLDAVVMRALERDRGMRYRKASHMARDLDEYLGARFSLEHMAEWMTTTFPPEAREEIPDGQAAPRTPSSASASSAMKTSPSIPRDRSGAPAPDLKRSLLLPVSIALAVGASGALLVGGLMRRQSPPPAPVPATVPPTVQPAPTAATAPAQPAPAPAAPQPASPQPAAVDPGPPQLEPAARELNRDPKRGLKRPPPPAAKPPAPKPRPKIEMFEDGDAPKPKIETFDD